MFKPSHLFLGGLSASLFALLTAPGAIAQSSSTTYISEAVVTHYSKQNAATSPVVTILDLSNPAGTGALYGDVWNDNGSNTPPKFSHPDWILGNLGMVYGIAIGSAKPSPDIFVATSHVFPPDFDRANLQPQTFPQSRHAIWRLQRDGGLAQGGYEVFYKFPSTNTGSSLGQIAYDPSKSVLYVSNTDDGTITALSDPAATVIDSYDHGTSRSLATPAMSSLTDNPASDETSIGRRVYAVQVNSNENRLYYSVYESGRNNTIWSVELTPSGGFIPGSIKREFTTPGSIDGGPVRDIAFNAAGTHMVLSEAADPQESRAWQYTGSHSGGWSATSPALHLVGASITHRNTAGGVDFAPDYLPPASGSSLPSAVDSTALDGRILATGYGLSYNSSGITATNGVQSTAVNVSLNSTFNTSDHFFIDVNGNLSPDSTSIGDVEALTRTVTTSEPCCDFVIRPVACTANGRARIRVSVTPDSPASGLFRVGIAQKPANTRIRYRSNGNTQISVITLPAGHTGDVRINARYYDTPNRDNLVCRLRATMPVEPCSP